MNVSGTLKQLPFAEVLLEVAQKKGTGTLVFEARRKKVEIDWLQGRIMQVSQKPTPASGNLGDMLVEIGEITTNQLAQAITQQRKSLSPLGRILIQLFRCDAMKIRLALRVQAVETLYEMFSWKDATFTFTHTIIDRKPNTFEPIDVHEFLAEAIPALDVWPEVRKKLHSPYLRVQSVGSSLPDDGQYSPSEQKVFTAIQLKEHTFRELSIVTGLGQFVVGRCLLRLLSERLIYLREVEKASVAWGRLLLGGSILDFSVWVLAMTLLVGAGTYLLAFAPYSPLRILQPRYRYRMVNPKWPQQVNRWRMERIRTALETYRMQSGQYPQTLKALEKKGWLSSSVLHSLDGRMFVYRIRRNTYYLGTPSS